MNVILSCLIILSYIVCNTSKRGGPFLIEMTEYADGFTDCPPVVDPEWKGATPPPFGASTFMFKKQND